MTFRQTQGMYVFICDECGDESDPESLGVGSAKPDFKEAWEFTKREGWRARKELGEWKHYCPDCG